MGLFSKLAGNLFGSSVKDIGEGVNDITNGFGDLAIKMRSAFTGEIDPSELAELEKATLALQAKVKTTQMEVNKVEAAHKSIFVAGWRPAIGWVGAISLFIAFPVKMTLALIVYVTVPGTPLPEFNIGEILGLITSMLGMGVMRSWEKGRSVNDKH